MTLPMFPLGTVLLPGCLLPVQVFEPRYLKMFESLEGDRQLFGVVLIERGHEVGGGDVRFDVGTVARVLLRRDLGDGRLAIVAGGTNRIKVEEWLEEDSFPVARVTEMVDDDDIGEGELEAVASVVRRVNSIAVEAGATGSSISPVDEGPPIVRLYHLIEASPLGPLDRQKLLSAASGTARVRLFVELLADIETLFLMKINDSNG